MTRSRRLLAIALAIAVLLSGCASPEAPEAPPAHEEPATFLAEDALPHAARAALVLDPSARLVRVEPRPEAFPVLARGGLAPAWAFVYRLRVSPGDLEPDPVYQTFLANATTETAVAEETPESFRVVARGPDGRVLLPERWTGSLAAALTLLDMGARDPVSLALAPDGCPGERARPAWIARSGARTWGVDALTGEPCRDTREEGPPLAVALGVAPAESDAERGQRPLNLTVKASTPPGDERPPPVRLGLTGLPGLDDALPWGFEAEFVPGTLAADPAGSVEARLVLGVNASAEPGKYTLYAYGREPGGRPTAGFTALVVRVR